MDLWSAAFAQTGDWSSPCPVNIWAGITDEFTHPAATRQKASGSRPIGWRLSERCLEMRRRAALFDDWVKRSAAECCSRLLSESMSSDMG